MRNLAGIKEARTKPARNLTQFEAGDTLVGIDGTKVTIKNIVLSQVHRSSNPVISIDYSYQTSDGKSGTEIVSFENLMRNLGVRK